MTLTGSLSGTLNMAKDFQDQGKINCACLLQQKVV